MSSRTEVFNILKKVFINKSFSNILLNNVSKSNIIDKDKNLIFNIVHGTITNKIFLEYITNQLIDNKKTDKQIQIII